ncbi:MAG: hypothetical protein EYC68_10065 [Chloroflexota bacterium]|nr:MAG: hypothetical protein EYC68_10065 [Chloroflexota bacterium]
MPVGRLTTKSKFHIDVAYWEKQGRNFRQEVYDALCQECKSMYSLEDVREVDYVDPVTGQVTRIDALLDCASAVCSNAPDFINPKMPLTRSIFRAFIAAGNLPQSAEEIYAHINKGSPQIILKELLSVQMESEGVTSV